MKVDYSKFVNEIKFLLKEHKALPVILLISVPAALGVGTWLYFRRQSRIVRYAKKFIGEEEFSGNEGFKDKEFDQLMRDYGDFRNSQAWCMSFAKMIWIKKFGKKYQSALDSIITPSTQTSWQNFVNDKSGDFKVSKTPKKGSIVIWQNYVNGKPQWTGHAGIVQRADINEFETIEGNTNNDEGSREGYEVAERTRKYNWNTTNGLRLKGFISIA